LRTKNRSAQYFPIKSLENASTQDWMERLKKISSFYSSIISDYIKAIKWTQQARRYKNWDTRILPLYPHIGDWFCQVANSRTCILRKKTLHCGKTANRIIKILPNFLLTLFKLHKGWMKWIKGNQSGGFSIAIQW